MNSNSLRSTPLYLARIFSFRSSWLAACFSCSFICCPPLPYASTSFYLFYTLLFQQFSLLPVPFFLQYHTLSFFHKYRYLVNLLPITAFANIPQQCLSFLCFSQHSATIPHLSGIFLSIETLFLYPVQTLSVLLLVQGLILPETYTFSKVLPYPWIP